MAQAAISDLAERLSIKPDTIEVADSFAVRWADGSLGLPEPGMAYIQMIVPGQLIRLKVGEDLYQYHAGPHGVRYAGRVRVSPDVDFDAILKWSEEYRENRAVELWGWLARDDDRGLLLFQRPDSAPGLPVVNAAYRPEGGYRWFEPEAIGEGHWVHLWGAVQPQGEEGHETGVIGLIRAELVDQPPPDSNDQ